MSEEREYDGARPATADTSRDVSQTHAFAIIEQVREGIVLIIIQ